MSTEQTDRDDICYIDHATGESDHMNAHVQTSFCRSASSSEGASLAAPVECRVYINNKLEWRHCHQCGGRQHEPTCTSKRGKADCVCTERVNDVLARLAEVEQENFDAATHMEHKERELACAYVLASEAEQRLAEVTRHLTEAQALAKVGTWHDDCRPNRAMAARELAKSQAVIDKLADTISAQGTKLEAAEATIATVKTLSADWLRRYTASWEYDKQHGLRDITTHLGGMAMAAEELDAALAAPAAGTPEVAVPESQGERDTTRLMPLPGAAASLFLLIADALDDAGDSIGFLGQYTSGRRIQERARRLREAAGTPAKEDA